MIDRKFCGAGALVLVVALTGCASLVAPSAELSAKVPVVEVGSKRPDTKDYILFVPAGREIPVKLSVKGSFLAAEGDAETKVKLGRNLYLYKHWASFDAKNWEKSHALFNAELSAGLDIDGGRVDIKLDTTR